jgi:hypothetical protein
MSMGFNDEEMATGLATLDHQRMGKEIRELRQRIERIASDLANLQAMRAVPLQPDIDIAEVIRLQKRVGELLVSNNEFEERARKAERELAQLKTAASDCGVIFAEDAPRLEQIIADKAMCRQVLDMRADAIANAREIIARAVYAKWEWEPDFVPWQPGGNSNKQEMARGIAMDMITRRGAHL